MEVLRCAAWEEFECDHNPLDLCTSSHHETKLSEVEPLRHLLASARETSKGRILRVSEMQDMQVSVVKRAKYAIITWIT